MNKGVYMLSASGYTNMCPNLPLIPGSEFCPVSQSTFELEVWKKQMDSAWHMPFIATNTFNSLTYGVLTCESLRVGYYKRAALFGTFTVFSLIAEANLLTPMSNDGYLRTVDVISRLWCVTHSLYILKELIFQVPPL